jgi:Rod binding domain-containing protein
MNAAPLHSAFQPSAEAMRPVHARAGDRSFASALSILRNDAPEGAESARAAAEEMVSITLVQPILASLRENSDAPPPFAPGDAERRFGPLFDAEIARRITKASNFPLVDQVARQLLARGSAGAPEGGAGGKVDAHG